jgi:hypothetical protein
LCVYTHFLKAFISYSVATIGQAGCFPCLAIVDTAAIIMGVQGLYCVLTYIPSDIFLRVVLLDFIVVLFLVFGRTSILLSIVVALI